MTKYNWQQPEWPHFRYDLSELQGDLLTIAEKMGRISGKIGHLDDELKSEAIIDSMVEEAVKTSEIEGEYINPLDVRSSIRNKLGLSPKHILVHDKRAQGIAELMLDVRSTYKLSLTEEKLFDWHVMLMSGLKNPNIKVGYWRVDDEPMQIVSGLLGKTTVHYEAPPSKSVPREMKRFIKWFNETAPGNRNDIKYAPVRAAIAHLYFECIHPFDDGNGRIGRAIAEKALSQGFGYPLLLSLSMAIDAKKKNYYSELKKASRKTEISDWIAYFVQIILNAQIQVETHINFILKKAKFFEQNKDILNERQLKVIKRMLRVGISGFEGGISAKKYMKLTGASKATATRDLQHLYAIHILKQIGSGRNVRYELVL